MASKLVRQLESILIDRIHDLPPNQPLPSEPLLAKELGVGRRTLRKAFASLEAKEIVRRVTGKGTFPARGAHAIPIFQQKARMIGLIAYKPFAMSYYTQRLGLAAFETAAQHGYNLVLTKRGLKENIYQILDDPHVCGMMLYSGGIDQKLVSELSERKKPLCLIDRRSGVDGVDSVRFDYTKAVGLAVRHLYQLGHRRIVYIPISDEEQKDEGVRGYHQTMRELKVLIRPEWALEHASPLVEGEEWISHFMSLPVSKRPTAVVTFSARASYRIMRAIIKFGLKVPNDFSVIAASDKVPTPLFPVPKLTRVAGDYWKLGETAIHHLLERIKKPNLPSRNTLLPVHLEIFESTGKI